MDNKIKIILFFILFLIFIYCFQTLKSKFSETISQENFIKNVLNPIFNKIYPIINDKTYQTVSELVPNQSQFNMSKTSITMSILPGNVDELNKYTSSFQTVLDQATLLSDYYQQLIVAVQQTSISSDIIYKPDEKNAFITYYTTLKNNTDLVIRYLKPKIKF